MSQSYPPITAWSEAECSVVSGRKQLAAAVSGYGDSGMISLIDIGHNSAQLLL